MVDRRRGCRLAYRRKKLQEEIQRKSDDLDDLSKAYARLAYKADDEASDAYLELVASLGRLTIVSLEDVGRLVDALWRVR